jgi:hypothetical protein
MHLFHRSEIFLKHGYLLVLIPPVAVLALAFLMFELSAAQTMKDATALMRSLVHPSEQISPLVILGETRGRYIWLATAIVNIVISVYVIILCAIVVFRIHAPKRLLAIAAAGAVLCAIGLVSLLYAAVNHGAVYRMVFGFTFLTLRSSGLFDPGFLDYVRSVVSVVNVFAVLAPVMAVLAACSTLAPLERKDAHLDDLADQMRHLKEVLNAGSALLVSGILHMDAWLRWPAALMSDKHAQDAVSGVALAVTIYWGATFTLMLIATYGPVAGYLSGQARASLNQEREAGRIRDPQQWLRDNGLSITLSEQLPQIGIILAPVIAGPLGSFLMSSSTPPG